MVKAAGIAAGTLFIAIGVAAQFGGGDLFSAPRYAQPVSQAKPQAPSAQASPQAKASPSPASSPVNLAVSANGTIVKNFGGNNGGGGGHKKHKG